MSRKSIVIIIIASIILAVGGFKFHSWLSKFLQCNALVEAIHKKDVLEENYQRDVELLISDLKTLLRKTESPEIWNEIESGFNNENSKIMLSSSIAMSEQLDSVAAAAPDFMDGFQDLTLAFIEDSTSELEKIQISDQTLSRLKEKYLTLIPSVDEASKQDIEPVHGIISNVDEMSNIFDQMSTDFRIFEELIGVPEANRVDQTQYIFQAKILGERINRKVSEVESIAENFEGFMNEKFEMHSFEKIAEQEDEILFEVNSYCGIKQGSKDSSVDYN